MSRRKFVAGNWKMFKTLPEAMSFVEAFKIGAPVKASPSVLIPPFPFIQSMHEHLKVCTHIRLGAQNCHTESTGAFTGEVSAEMLASVGAEFVLVGHSERRMYFHETDGILAKKIDKVLATGLQAIFCCGEPLEVRNEEKHYEMISNQLHNGLFHISAEQMKNVVIAYEPVWAIGTGVNASPEQAQDMHAFIRSLLAAHYDQEVADQTTILYGGSVKPDNAATLFGQADVDGGLVGGASLNPDDFVKIVNALPL